MLLILPPSETKRDGGDPDRVLDLGSLSYAALTRQRRDSIAALRRLSRNASAASDGLRLGPTQRFEIDRNRRLLVSPSMPAIERYTGVLYDALDASTLAADARRLASRTVVIHSALFGIIGADDAIPAYRMSHDSRLPGLRLGAHWRDGITAELERHRGLLLDLRSEAYVSLGPVPASANAFFLRVVTRNVDGTTRALNHFNKKGKGELVRTLLQGGIDHPDLASLLDWARGTGVRLAPGAPGELELTVDGVV